MIQIMKMCDCNDLMIQIMKMCGGNDLDNENVWW